MNGCTLEDRFGHSLGSAVSVFTAVSLLEKRNIRVAGLILQVSIPIPTHIKSCFLSTYRVVFDCRVSSRKDMYKVADTVLLGDRIEEQITKVQSPVCLIHGMNDMIVPFIHAKRLFLLIPEEYRYKCLFVVISPLLHEY